MGCSTLGGMFGKSSNFTETVAIETGAGGVETAIILLTDIDRAGYGRGGLPLLASMIRGFQEQYGSRLVWVDVGKQTRAPETQSRLESLGLRATLPALESGPLVISVGRVRVGLISLRKVASLTPAAAKAEASAQAERARAQGAQLVVLIAGTGVECGGNPVSSGYRIHKPTDLGNSCLPMDSRSRQRLAILRAAADAAGGIDLIASGQPTPGDWKAGGQIRWLAGEKNAVPLVRPQSRGMSFAMAFLNYDENKRESAPEKARVEGIFPVCERVSEATANCQPGTRGPWARMRIRGKAVGVTGAVASTLRWETEDEERKHQSADSEALGELAAIDNPQKRLDFLADVLRQETQADVAFVHSGALVGELPKGKVTRAGIRAALDETSEPGVVTLSPRELRQLAKALYNGSHEFPGVSGGRLRIVDRPYDGAAADIDGDGRTDYWEIDRLLGLQVGGKDLKEPYRGAKRAYKVALPGELLEGRDGTVWLAPHGSWAEKAERLGFPLSEVLARALQRGKLLVEADSRLKLERAVKKVTRRRGKRR